MNKKRISPLIKALIAVLSVLIWLLLWKLFSSVIDPNEIIFPGPIKTFSAFFKLSITAEFWNTVLSSILRIFIGLIIGVAVGMLCAIICRLLPPIRAFTSIGMTIMKSTPVASVILILWAIVGIEYTDNLPIIISALMVAPIIWQNLIDGFDSINSELLEVTRVFGFSRLKTARVLIMPTLVGYFVPAFLTSVGLAWKSGIAAEIIAYVSDSIGKQISNAKSDFSGDEMLAWTLVVILISLAFEYLFKLVIRKFGGKYVKNQSSL